MGYTEIVLLCGATVISATVVIGALITSKKQKNAPANIRKDNIDEEEFREPETLEFHATVIDMNCQTRTVGIKQPELLKEFFVFFKDDNGKVYKIQVPEDMYECFDTLQVGTLTLIDGELFGFSLDEDNDTAN